MVKLHPQENILINQGGHACLVDFGLSTIVGVGTHLDPLDPNILSLNHRDSLMSPVEGGSYPWMGPELLESNEGSYRQTQESDIYALGMVIYEVRVLAYVIVMKDSDKYRFYAGQFPLAILHIRLRSWQKS
jgi:serine/threonine protein kinase